MSRLQNEDFKSVAQLTSAGGDQTQLLNSTKIYANEFVKPLSQAFTDGNIANSNNKWFGSLYTNSQTGADINLTLSTKMIIQVNGSSLTSIASLDDNTANRLIMVINTGSDLTIKNQSVAGSAGKKIYTGSGSDVTLAQNQAMFFCYNSTLTSWVVVGAVGSGGSGITALTGSVTASGSGSQVAKLNAPRALDNVSLAISTFSNQMVISLKNAAGSDPSASDPLNIAMRSSTLTSGLWNIRQATGSTSLTVSSGSTLGMRSGASHNLYVYLLDNAGTLELAISMALFDDSKLITTFAEGGAGAADLNYRMYSTTARTNVPFRCIGKLVSNQTTAGTWTSVPSRISIGTYETFSPNNIVKIRYGHTGAYLISNNVPSRVNYDSRSEDTHNAVTTGVGAWNSGLGGNNTANWIFVAPEDGSYSVTLNIEWQSTAWTAGTYIMARLYINDTSNENYLILRYLPTAFTYYWHDTGSNYVNLNAGDTVRVRIWQVGVAGGATLAGDATANYIELVKVGPKYV